MRSKLEPLMCSFANSILSCALWRIERRSSVTRSWLPPPIVLSGAVLNGAKLMKNGLVLSPRSLRSSHSMSTLTLNSMFCCIAEFIELRMLEPSEASGARPNWLSPKFSRVITAKCGLAIDRSTVKVGPVVTARDCTSCGVGEGCLPLILNLLRRGPSGRAIAERPSECVIAITGSILN